MKWPLDTVHTYMSGYRIRDTIQRLCVCLWVSACARACAKCYQCQIEMLNISMLLGFFWSRFCVQGRHNNPSNIRRDNRAQLGFEPWCYRSVANHVTSKAKQAPTLPTIDHPIIQHPVMMTDLSSLCGNLNYYDHRQDTPRLNPGHDKNKSQ